MRRPPSRWLRFLPAAVEIDAGRVHPVGVRLELPEDAEPGVYAAVRGVRPGGGREGLWPTLRIERDAHARLRRAATLATWLVAALIGGSLALVLARTDVTPRAPAAYVGSDTDLRRSQP